MQKSIVILFLSLFLNAINSMAQGFVHPGGLHKKSDLERMKYMVQLNKQPWVGGYAKLTADSRSSYNYSVQGDTTITVVTRDAPFTNSTKLYNDARAAYYNALMYNINGDVRHAQKCVEIFKAWSNLTQVTGGGTESLNGGLLGYMLIEAAEIIQSTYAGWGSKDKQKFKDMLVYPGYSSSVVPSSLSATNGTFYWRIYMGDPGRHGNQDIAGMRTMMLMGIFLDNRVMYDRALRYLQSMPHRTDDFEYASGPSVTTSLNFKTSWFDDYDYVRQSTIADYGYNGALNNYILSNGQCQESSRDQGHTNLGLAMLNNMCEMAWNQGDDIYSFSNNRLLKGLSYNCRYNVSYVKSFSDQLTPWEPTIQSGEYQAFWDRTGRWYSRKINPWNGSDSTRLTRGYNSTINPNWEIALAHYGVRFGLSADSLKWLSRAKSVYFDSLGYEGSASVGLNNADLPGFGTLTFSRPTGCAGDPISGFSNGKPVFKIPVLPATLEAENYDYFSGNAQDRSSYEITATNTSGKYRTDGGVDIDTCSEGGYKITNIENGEWLTYTIQVPTSSNYAIRIRYAAIAAGGKIKFTFDGSDKTTEVTVPYGAPHSTGNTDWKDFVVAVPIALTSGVQSLKVTFSGTSNAFELNSISLVSAATVPVQLVNFTASSSDSKTIQLSFATATEVNNDYFFIEKSKDGQSFDFLTKVEAKNTASVYYVNDDKPFNGSNLYRLSQVDKDGVVKILSTASFTISSGKIFSINPNPLRGQFIEVKGIEAGIANIEIMSVAGKILYKQTKIVSADGALRIDLQSKPSNGSYIVMINKTKFSMLIVP